MINSKLNQLIERYPALSVCKKDIEKVFEVLKVSFINGGTLLICGNGGSAADCEHWSGELLKGFTNKRALATEIKKTLPKEIGDNLQNALSCIPLTSFTSLASAFANDVEPQLVFAQLVWALAKQRDVLVGISTSGNSLNILNAIITAKSKGLKTIALTGELGGKLADIADVSIKVPVIETFKVQELHLPVYHCICLMLEDYFFKS